MMLGQLRILLSELECKEGVCCKNCLFDFTWPTCYYRQHSNFFLSIHIFKLYKKKFILINLMCILENVNIWLNLNKLSLIAQKTKLMVFY